MNGWMGGESEGRWRQRREGEVLMNGLMAHWPTNVTAASPVAPRGLVKHTYSQWYICKLIFYSNWTYYSFTTHQGHFCLLSQGYLCMGTSIVTPLLLSYTKNCTLANFCYYLWLSVLKHYEKEEAVQSPHRKHKPSSNIWPHWVSKSVKCIFGLEHLMSFRVLLFVLTVWVRGTSFQM